MFKKGKRVLASVLASTMLLSSMMVYAAESADDSGQQATLTVNSSHGTVSVTGDDVTSGEEENTYLVTKGSTVKVQIDPDENYELDQVTLGEKDLSVDGDGKTQFQMPGKDATLKVTFVSHDSDDNSQYIGVSPEEAALYEAGKIPERTPNITKTYPAETSKKTRAATSRAGVTMQEYGSKTFASVAGFSRASLLKRMRNTVSTDYYLSTTYRPDWYIPGSGMSADLRNPNGDCEGTNGAGDRAGTAAMNCTGFVWHMLTKAGADKDIPALNGWNSYLTNNNIKYRTYTGSDFDTIVDTIVNEDDWIEPGDIIWMWDADAADMANGLGYGISDHHHVGLFTGSALDDYNPLKGWFFKKDGSENGFWHSSNLNVPKEGNLITEITPKTRCLAVTVIKTGEHLSGSAQIVKTSANTDLTNGNSCYSISGAKYGVYTDKSCKNKVATFTTTENGKSNKVELDAGRYYVKEITAPKGYALDTKVYTLDVESDKTTTLKVTDKPQSDPVYILLGKIDAETTKNMPQGSASLGGAEFTVKYYDTKDAMDAGKASRLWVLETDEEGFVALDDDYKISGDDFYYMSNGDIAIPLGYITIQETKAPEGYLLNDEVFVRQITSDGTAESVNTYNEPTIKEDIVRGDLELVKFEEPLDEEEDHMTPLEGIVFEITSKTTGKTVEITTDKRGFASTKQLGVSDRGNLVFDTYIVHEKNTHEGLQPVKDFEVTISEEGQVLYYILANKQIISPVRLVKADSTTGKTVPIADTEFQLLDEKKNPITMETHYPDTVTHETFKTDKSGSFTLPEKLPAGIYYFRELNAPEGYLLNGEDLQFEIAEGHDWDEPLTVTFEDTPVMGQIKIAKTDADSKEPLSGALFMVTAAEDIVTPDGTIRATAGDVVDTITTDEDGKAQSKELFLGKYTVEEVKQPAGYVLSDKVWDVELTYKDQETAIVTEDLAVENVPTKVVVAKTQTGTETTLEGVQFAVWNKAMTEDDVDFGMTQKTFYTTDKNGQILVEHLLPGTYCIQETATIPGYALDDTVFEFTVANDGRIEGKECHELTIENDKIEVVATKVINSENDTQMAYPRTVTVVDTVSMIHLQPSVVYTLKGELVDQETGKPITDKDGEPITAELEFTADKSQMDVDVTFQDVDLSDYAGKTITVYEHLYQDGVEIGGHTDLNDENQQLQVMNPEIHTTATEQSKEIHNTYAEKDVTIRDLVECSGLIPGDYVLKGILMDKETGEPLLIDGKEVTAEQAFTATESEMAVEVYFRHLDLSQLSGHQIVVFETLYQEDTEIVDHADINDKDQEIRVCNPELHTTATDKQNGTHDSAAKNKVVILDEVDYKDLIPGEYVLKGVLMDKKTGEPLLIDGKQVTSEQKVEVKEETGTVEMEFKLDASELEGTSTVVFEYLYPVNGDEVGKTPIASHEDINDEGQTVNFVSPEQAPQTGVGSHLIWYALGILAIVGCRIGYVVYRKKKN